MEFDRNRLKELRQKQGLTLEDLAKKCMSSKSYIWEIENKGTIEPSGRKIFLMAQALNVPMDYFYGVDIDNTKKVLGTLISWMVQSASSPISYNEAQALIEMLWGTNQ